MMKIRAIFSFYDFNFNWKISLWSAKWRGKPRNKILIFPGKLVLQNIGVWEVGHCINRLSMDSLDFDTSSRILLQILRKISAHVPNIKKNSREIPNFLRPLSSIGSYSATQADLLCRTPQSFCKNLFREILTNQKTQQYPICINIMCA